MTTRHVLVAYGAVTIAWSAMGFLVTGAPTAFIGVAFGVAIALLARSEGAAARRGAAGLVALMAVQAAYKLAVNLTSVPIDGFGAFFFATLLAVSLATGWAGLVAYRRERSGWAPQTISAG